MVIEGLGLAESDLDLFLEGGDIRLNSGLGGLFLLELGDGLGDLVGGLYKGAGIACRILVEHVLNGRKIRLLASEDILDVEFLRRLHNPIKVVGDKLDLPVVEYSTGGEPSESPFLAAHYAELILDLGKPIRRDIVRIDLPLGGLALKDTLFIVTGTGEPKRTVRRDSGPLVLRVDVDILVGGALDYGITGLVLEKLGDGVLEIVAGFHKESLLLCRSLAGLAEPKSVLALVGIETEDRSDLGGADTALAVFEPSGVVFGFDLDRLCCCDIILCHNCFNLLGLTC